MAAVAIVAGGVTVSLPWNVPLKGTSSRAAAGTASAAVRIIAAIATPIWNLVSGCHMRSLSLVQAEADNESGHASGIFSCAD